MVTFAAYSNMFYSIYKYLNFLLEQRPSSKWNDDQFEELVPWSSEVQALCNNNQSKFLASSQRFMGMRGLLYRTPFYQALTLDPYKEQIYIWRCEPYSFNGKRIFRELKKRGYEGSIGPIYRFLRRMDEDVGNHISSKATVRHESPPGDQAQFDWTEYTCCIECIKRGDLSPRFPYYMVAIKL